MIYLILSILFTIALFLIFKEYGERNINTNQAITFNYLTASIIGFLISDIEYNISQLLHAKWFYLSIILGVFFIFMFNVMAITTQRLGISISSMASKISLIIPVIGAVIMQDLSLGIYKTIGIIMAMIAVYLTFKKEKPHNKLTLAVILFLGAGILDMSIDYIRNNYLSSNVDFHLFIITIFLSAFIIGLLKLLYKNTSIHIKNIVAGIILGVPNYFSIYFVLLALENLGAIYVFPILNISVVLFSALISYIVYEENMNRNNWIGILLACFSIFIILYN